MLPGAGRSGTGTGESIAAAVSAPGSSEIRTASGGNPAVFSSLSPLAVPLLPAIKPGNAAGERRVALTDDQSTHGSVRRTPDSYERRT
jgi:hypothetical protein